MRGKWAEELNPFDPWTVEVIGDLAQTHETPDGQTYTFKLTPGVKFQDVPPVSGRPLTAQIVKYSYERYQASGVWTESFKVIDSIQTPDNATVVIKLKDRRVLHDDADSRERRRHLPHRSSKRKAI